jgi:tRNA(Arg) A34 adenosine deaminase TadA
MSINIAIKIAKSLPEEKGKQRLCAVITDKRGKILSVGVNNYTKSHPLQASYAKKVGRDEACFLHAEVASLVGLGYNDKPKAYKISIARVMKNGRTALAKPCRICQEALKDFNIRVIEFTN